jgi:predicted negative regulator of RcsB-dependent stress response
MATSLDLQEQEQLDTLKAFWKQYGNLITWVLILALSAFAAWNGWQWWQRDQGVKAGALFEELDRAVLGGDADRAGRVMADLKERYPRTAFAQQGALATARLQFEKGQVDAAKGLLGWVAEHGTLDEYRTVARLRLAGVLIEAKQYDEALKQLAEAKAPTFEALVADRRGDVYLAQGKADEARQAFQTAWAAMDEKLDYRRLVEAKLVSLAAAPVPASGAARAASGAGR